MAAAEADRAAAITVFVDDAVLGRFPPVCAGTGAPSDGTLTIHAPVVRSRLSAAWFLLLLAGPAGWAVLVVLALVTPDGQATLSVQVPWTVAAEQRVEAVRRRRRRAWWTATATAALVVALLVVPVSGRASVTDAGGGPLTLPAQIVGVGLALVAAAAVVAGLVAPWRLGRATVGVELDASRRWVTLRNVDPAFARAVRAGQAPPRPAPQDRPAGGPPVL
jgi:hypothetical protein